ncbi:MAG: hypothetical protein PHR83_01115, partial [Paludibacter sp.]|nr:hypothetical protein [Paludibacter sp.]
MMNRYLRIVILYIALITSNFLLVAKVDAQFTIRENFHSNTVSSNVILGGTPTAFLTSGNPDVANDGWLRLTNSLGNQKGFAYINSSFPSTLGALIDFEYKIWRTSTSGNTGADGIGIYFFDASSTFSLGGYGGSLGYAPNSAAGSPTGLAGGYLGIGLDEFGNFSNPTEGRNGGPGAKCNSVTLRGPTTSNATTTNPYLTYNQLQSNASSNTNSIDYNTATATRPTDAQFYRRVKITIVPTGTVSNPQYSVTVVWRLTPTGSDTQILSYTTTTPPPTNLKVGFAASTGGSSNYHEIRNMLITTPGGVRVDNNVDKLNAKVGDQVTYTINAYNLTNTALTNLILSDSIKNGIGKVVNLGSAGDFTINSITFNNNGNVGNTAVGYSNGIPVTTGLINPFSASLNMAANTISSFTIVGTINNLPAGGVLKNAVGVDPTLSGITDEDLTNNNFDVSTNVLNADFVVENSVDKSCADITTGNTYTLLVSNTGTENSVAGKTVTVTDNIPAGFTITSASGNGWAVSHVGNNYTFTRSDVLTSMSSYPAINVGVTPPSSGVSWVNTATVAYAGVEASTNNNSSSATLYAKLAAPIVSSPVNYCQGSTAVALTATGSNLLWYTSVGGVGSVTPPTPSTTSVGSTAYYVSQSNGSCESNLSTILVKVNSATTSTTAISICPSSLPYLWNGKTYTAGGTYQDTLTNSQGCDSIATLELTVKSASFSTTNVSICNSSLPYLWNGKTYTAAGTYQDTLTNAQSCDSIATLQLTVKSASASTTNIAVCSSSLPYLWNGKNYSIAGTYQDTLTNAQGCDSIATLQLTVKTASFSTTQTSICPGALLYTWNGKIYNAGGIYQDTLTNVQGCDSIATLQLTVKTASASTTNIAVCSSSLPYLWNGKNYNAGGTYKDTLTNSIGCDSIATLLLTVKTASTSTTSISICNTSLPYVWNGKNYSTAGIYKDTLMNAQGCDSIATLQLTVKTISFSTTQTSICASALPYTWNGKSYSTAGIYQDTLTNAQGCDSIATLQLTIKTASFSTTPISICNSALPYNWNGRTYTATGTYKDTLTNAQGCDSIATLQLTVKSASFSTTQTSICASSLPYVWNGRTYTTGGTYQDTLVNARGCDSIATLQLTVKTASFSTTPISICPSSLPYNWNGKSYNAGGTYKDTLTNSLGCDSIATLQLTIKSVSTSTTPISICNSSLPYVWNGRTYTATGTYKDTLVNAQGCDSIATLQLTVKAASFSTTPISICNSALPYSWNGKTYNTGGTYQDTLTNAQGCDSIATLELTVKAASFSTTQTSICPSALPYNWNGKSYTIGGTYQDTLTNAQGCDSIATLQLTVKTASTSTTNIAVCPSNLPYSWNG